MSYSIAYPPRSQKAFLEMGSFLRENVRPFHRIAPNEGVNPVYDPTTRVAIGDELEHDKGRKIGFNYSNGITTFDYMIDVLRWAALRTGRSRSFKKFGIWETVPYIVYDGYEAWPVLKHGHPNVDPRATQFLGDVYGFRPARRSWEGWTEDQQVLNAEFIRHESQRLAEQDAAIRSELERLTALWGL